MQTTNFFLSTADRPSLPETVYHQLRHAILNGALKPGEVLRQEEIAQKLGVSRAPLREALPRLEADGIVVSRPRRGYAVVSLDPAEIEDIFDLRATVEEKAVRIATERRKPADIKRVRALLATMESAAPDTAEERARWFDLNFQFHDVLAAAAGRKHLQRLVTNLRTVVEPYIRVEIILTGDVLQANQEHGELADAFEAGDVNLAGQLARAHVEHTAERLLEGLRGSGKAASRR